VLGLKYRIGIHRAGLAIRLKRLKPRVPDFFMFIGAINNLLMISINGPCLRDWNAKKYVLLWLRTGRHGALDKPKGKSSHTWEVKTAAKIFA